MHFSESINKKSTGRKLPNKMVQHVGRTEICSTCYASELISTYCPEILLDLKAFKLTEFVMFLGRSSVGQSKVLGSLESISVASWGTNHSVENQSLVISPTMAQNRAGKPCSHFAGC